MAISWDSNSISTLFSSLPSKGTGFFGTSNSTSANMLSDYYSIKNGSYHKLMKAYYGQDSMKVTTGSDTSKVDSKDKTTSKDKTDSTDSAAKAAAKAEAEKANEIKKSADSLKDSTTALLDNKLYEKVANTDKEGNTTQVVDTNKLYQNVSNFVDSYNDMLKSGAKSDTRNVLSNVASMTSDTRANSKMLSKVGITINDDNTLKIDEETFKKASVNDIKTLFGDRGGYADRIGSRATTVSSAVATKANSYNNTGNYSAVENTAAFTDVV